MTATFLYRFRELLTHTMFRYGLVCPIFCLMRDHMHMVWMGLCKGSYQINAMKHFRTRCDGLVIVDTGMSAEDGTRIMEEFRKLTDKPVKAIIFTHAHGDHTGGVTAFFGNERPQIWAHKNFGSEAGPWKAGGLTFQNVRGARQAGFKLPPEQRINNGVAPALLPDARS